MTAESSPAPAPPRRSTGSLVLIAVAVLAAVVAVAVAVVAWLQPLPDLDREDARQFTADALEAAGFTEGSVRPGVRADVYPEPEGDAEFDVWITITDLEGQPVELWIDRERAQAVLVNDNTADGPLLTDDQFRILDDYDVHPGADERRQRNSTVTAAAVVVVGLAAALIIVLWRRAPSDDPSPPGE